MPDDKQDPPEATPAGEELSELAAGQAYESPTQVVDHGASWTLDRGGDDAATETEVLQVGAPEPTRPGGRFGIAGLVGAVALALVAAGGVYAYNLLSGGGSQPEQYVPANAIAFVKVDLDPAAGQKLAATRYFRHFPAADDVLGDEDDIRRILFELAQEGNDALASLDFEQDIEPWLGDRVGVAVIPPEQGDEPDVVAVLQVRDEDRAADGLRGFFEATDNEVPGVAFGGGYALLAEDEEIAERARQAAAEASLADAETFSADMAEFDDGVGAFWVDLDRIGDLAAELDPTLSATSPGLQSYFDQVYSGRVAGVVSFADDYADLTVRGIGSSGFGFPTQSGEPVAPLFETLPGDTLAALAYTGLDESIESSWDDFMSAIASQPGGEDVEAAIAQIETDYGIHLPDDLLTLLGSQTLLAVAGDTFVSASPSIAYRAETDAARAGELLGLIQDLVAEEGGELPLAWEADGSTLVVGMSQADLSAIQSGTGIADPAAQTALPDLGRAQQAFWLDLDRISEIILEETGSVADETLSHIAGIGMTASVGDDGSWTATVRVVAD